MKRTAGISLMLLIFLSLCLITFSLLSLSGANADAKLAQKSADRTTEYYAAVTEANEILDEIDSQLASALREALSKTDSGTADTEASGVADTGTQVSGNPKAGFADITAAMSAYADACSAISTTDAALSWEAADASGSNSDANISGNSPDADANASDSNADAGAVRNDDSPENQTVSIVGTFQYDVSVTEDQLLHVELSVVWPESDADTLYRITCWQVVSTAEWSADTSQNLYRTGTAD